MKEFLETYNDRNQPTGLVARDRVHQFGLWHRAVNVFLFRTDGRLITQLRHASKDVWPGTWDLSVSEHLTPGESYLDGAVRGLNEELGIKGVELEPLGEEVRTMLELPELGIRDCELQMCFRGISDAEIVLQVDEVAEVRLIHLSELRGAMCESPGSFTPWFCDRAGEIGLLN